MVTTTATTTMTSNSATQRRWIIGIVIATLVICAIVIADLATGGRPDPRTLRAQAKLLDGAWAFHEHLIPESYKKPLRIWMEVGDQDLFNPNVMRDGMHDWVLANENMAKAFAAKGYPYQFVFARNARHVDYKVKMQTLPEALEWLWKDYRPAKN